jgi:hypothetical protein
VGHVGHAREPAAARDLLSRLAEARQSHRAELRRAGFEGMKRVLRRDHVVRRQRGFDRGDAFRRVGEVEPDHLAEQHLAAEALEPRQRFGIDGWLFLLLAGGG